MSIRLTRRTMIGAAGASLFAPAIAAAPTSPAFSWDMLQAEALKRARQPYVAPPAPPAGLDAVTYDALNHISYRADAALWRGTPQEVRFFPQSRNAQAGVPVSVVERGGARALPFTRELFAGGERLPPTANGFSGFRVMMPGGNSDWLAFQGASYFRASGALDQYGLSARALAIDTGLSTPEEFPSFTHFWLEQGPGDAVTIYALLDSPRAAGAWRFVNRRGPQGVTQDVSCVLQLRADVARLGIAPLTSMFWYGEGDRDKAVDWRPEIHDSDGLAMLTGGGERIWRPLRNPKATQVNSFADRAPKGFGLLQRDRNFDHYQDDGVFYEKRPSLWVEPQGDWGAGSVMLVELPTTRETEDNIVACWSPEGPARAGRRYSLSYRLRWIAGEPNAQGVARVVDTWRGVAAAPGFEPVKGASRVVVDFAGDALKGFDRASGVAPNVSADHGKVLTANAYPVVGTSNRWRLIADVAPDSDRAVDLRAFLHRSGAALTETFLYQL
ncbi:glucan biosynthesis protein [uncultured Sphingomonas sp.]|uniref:glucan biosynthesis protein n=1 Tax=uncultured Sphingomonas sp. TaxID=158754 RepID=UPI0025F72A5E|nr:glucan biosynthesis protein [uncultured Sphingomonas sp.]